MTEEEKQAQVIGLLVKHGVSPSDIRVAKKYFSLPRYLQIGTQIFYRFTMLLALSLYGWGGLSMIDLIKNIGFHFSIIPYLFFLIICVTGCKHYLTEIVFGPNVIRKVVKCALESPDDTSPH